MTHKNGIQIQVSVIESDMYSGQRRGDLVLWHSKGLA